MKKHAIGILIVTWVFITCLAQACTTSEEVVFHDILGQPPWTITYADTGARSSKWVIIFEGDETSGTAGPGPGCWGCPYGLYWRTANDITIGMSWPSIQVSPSITFSGIITGNNSMGGTWVSTSGPSGLWWGVR